MSELFPQDTELCPNAFVGPRFEGYTYKVSDAGTKQLEVAERDYSQCARDRVAEVKDIFDQHWPCDIGRLGGCAMQNSISAFLRRERREQAAQ